MTLPSLSDEQTATALAAITRNIRRVQAARARGDATVTTFDRLAEADRAVWRCRCGSWRFGSRACAVCPRIVEVAA